VGERGRLEIVRPFNAPSDAHTVLLLEQDATVREIVMPVADQYTIQGELFAKAVLDDEPVPVPLEDALANMRVIDAVFESTGAASGQALAERLAGFILGPSRPRGSLPHVIANPSF
jgi:predicted dehydrogenase